MRDRLIELLREAKEHPEKTCPRWELPTCSGCNYDKGDECDRIARLADHLLKNGVIVPPCKAGDTVWVIDADREDYTGYMFLAQIGDTVIVSSFVNDYDFSETIDYFISETAEGSAVDLYVVPLENCYASKEAAEKALEGDYESKTT